jgi:hypothetical protein
MRFFSRRRKTGVDQQEMTSFLLPVGTAGGKHSSAHKGGAGRRVRKRKIKLEMQRASRRRNRS